ncbi:hypothetical protein B0I10_108124 [Flavobacterium lacus]|uniref:Uncharacterized protein n=1 Tax=Flavobacterium lacus TaxID=1353778 RepID=A0A328WMX2_9FLAO|nr:hypothetical protein B0I10_108124 [Flavobacterium lacus]
MVQYKKYVLRAISNNFRDEIDSKELIMNSKEFLIILNRNSNRKTLFSVCYKRLEVYLKQFLNCNANCVLITFIVLWTTVVLFFKDF